MRDLFTRPQVAAVVAGVTFAGIVAGLYLCWPVGIGIGLVVGIVAVLLLGRHMAAVSAAEPQGGWPDLAAPIDDDLERDLDRLHRALDADYDDFVRAALLVADTQVAALPAVQRELGVSAQRARFLIALLEAEGFVAPVGGSGTRTVLIAPEHVEALRELLAS